MCTKASWRYFCLDIRSRFTYKLQSRPCRVSLDQNLYCRPTTSRPDAFICILGACCLHHCEINMWSKQLKKKLTANTGSIGCWSSFLVECIVVECCYDVIIPHNCHGRRGRRPCKFFLAGVNFYRFNVENWQFTV